MVEVGKTFSTRTWTALTMMVVLAATTGRTVIECEDKEVVDAFQTGSTSDGVDEENYE
jgi:hypothetical protein